MRYAASYILKPFWLGKGNLHVLLALLGELPHKTNYVILKGPEREVLVFFQYCIVAGGKIIIKYKKNDNGFYKRDLTKEGDLK